ncbi:LacI family DNA-binding transcriptional regulator [Streptomyces flaveolus]|uniref:LacI family DNA-binding transcriptional regulator n=1 Tax=Streptomyces flaveolus TaxID=67297 RepID=A0ABV1VG16_9ACTN
MSDIAQAAGVSSASVSYALNGSPGVGPEVRERILKIADELGFRPSRLARELRTGASSTIGLLLADIANPFYTEVAAGVVAATADEGFEVFVSHVGGGRQRQADAALAHVDRNCSGLILTSLVDADRPLLTKLERERVPFVQLYRRLEGVSADWVGIDDRAAGVEIALHMLASGRRRIAVLGGPQESSATSNRVSGFREALHQAGVQALNEPEVWGDFTRQSGAMRARAVLARHPDVDGIICSNDVIAVGVMDVCRETGRSVPEDVALSGFDDMSFSSAGPLQLTTVTVPREALGRRAAQLLLRRIAGDDGPPRAEQLPYELRIRATTAVH